MVWRARVVPDHPGGVEHPNSRHRAGKTRQTQGRRGTPILWLAGMAASTLALGLSSLWRCHDDQSAFFAPLSWTLGLFLGVLEPKYQIFDSHGAGIGHCGALDIPIGLELARLLAVSTTLTTAVAAALTLFRSQFDRFAVWRAHSLAVVVGIDDDAVSMLRALASRPDRKETLLIITGAAGRPCVAAVRNLGARVREVSLADPDPLGSCGCGRSSTGCISCRRIRPSTKTASRQSAPR